MKKSIKIRLAVTYIGIMCISLAVMLLVNSFFLEKVYLYKKTESLKKVYNTMNDTKDALDYSSLASDDAFKRYCDEKNLSMIVVNRSTSRIVFAYAKNSERLYSEIQFGVLDDFIRGKREVLESTETYLVEKKTDDSKAMDSLNMVGMLDNGNGFLITTPAQSLKDSALISNVFYLYIGLATILVSSIAIWFISRQITKPLQQLSDLSMEMANLNFEAKYTSTSEDEIGVLGNNLNRMSKALEKTISELQTANNELQKDIEKKEQIDEMRKEFLSNVSHELKTPIALIQGYAEGLQECINDDPESREFYCEVIMDEAAKMNNMVKKLLTLNQLEFGNDTVTMERFNLTDLVNGVVQSAQILASQKEAEISFLQTEPVYVWGDEFKIEEVVTNYVSNALNHVDGEKKIEIKAVRRDDVIRLSVFNTGEVIPEEDLEKIWIKFYKVDKARTREYGGSGIGLSIVKAIMDSMNQKCGVINYENGVEFWFELACGDRFC